MQESVSDAIEQSDRMLQAVMGNSLSQTEIVGLEKEQHLLITFLDTEGGVQQAVLSATDEHRVKVFATGEAPNEVLALEGALASDIAWPELAQRLSSLGMNLSYVEGP